MAPIRWASVRRNEVGKVASPRAGASILVEDDRQQRAGLLLRDVRYRLFAEFEFIPQEKRGKVRNPVPEWLVDPEDAAELRKDETPAKYAAIFERRAKKGQCFNQPYLGCREFSCSFRLTSPDDASKPIDETRDLGWMLYDLDFASNPLDPKPLFFRAKMEKGVINVPDRDNSEEVRG